MVERVVYFCTVVPEAIGIEIERETVLLKSKMSGVDAAKKFK